MCGFSIYLTPSLKKNQPNKPKLNHGSHKVIKQLRRNWFYPTKEVPARLTKSRSNDCRWLQQTPLGQSRSKMDTLLVLDLIPQLMVDMTFSACDMFEGAGHSNLNWRGGYSINKTKQKLLRALSQAFCAKVLWQKVAEATRKAISYSKLFLFELRGGSSSQMNCFKSIFGWIHIQ